MCDRSSDPTEHDQQSTPLSAEGLRELAVAYGPDRDAAANVMRLADLRREVIAYLDAARERPSALDVERLRTVRDEFAAMRHGPDPYSGELDSAYYAGHDAALDELLALLDARLTELRAALQQPAVQPRGSGPPAKGPNHPDRIAERVAEYGHTDQPEGGPE